MKSLLSAILCKLIKFMISSQHISIPQDNLNHGVVDNIVELVSQKEEVDEEPFGTWYGDKEENF